MAKIIDKGLMTKDDPAYSNGWIIGPVIVSRKSTKSRKPKSEPNAKPSRPPKVTLTETGREKGN